MTFLEATKRVWEKITIVFFDDYAMHEKKFLVTYPDNAKKMITYSRCFFSSENPGETIKKDIMHDPRFVYLVSQELKRTQAETLRCSFCDSIRKDSKSTCSKCGGTDFKIEPVVFSITEK